MPCMKELETKNNEIHDSSKEKLDFRSQLLRKLSLVNKTRKKEGQILKNIKNPSAESKKPSGAHKAKTGDKVISAENFREGSFSGIQK